MKNRGIMFKTPEEALQHIKVLLSDGNTEALELVQDQAEAIADAARFAEDESSWKLWTSWTSIRNIAVEARHVIYYRSRIHNATSEEIGRNGVRWAERLAIHGAGLAREWAAFQPSFDPYEILHADEC